MSKQISIWIIFKTILNINDHSLHKYQIEFHSVMSGIFISVNFQMVRIIDAAVDHKYKSFWIKYLDILIKYF